MSENQANPERRGPLRGPEPDARDARGGAPDTCPGHVVEHARPGNEFRPPHRAGVVPRDAQTQPVADGGADLRCRRPDLRRPASTSPAASIRADAAPGTYPGHGGTTVGPSRARTQRPRPPRRQAPGNRTAIRRCGARSLPVWPPLAHRADRRRRRRLRGLRAASGRLAAAGAGRDRQRQRRAGDRPLIAGLDRGGAAAVHCGDQDRHW